MASFIIKLFFSFALFCSLFSISSSLSSSSSSTKAFSSIDFWCNQTPHPEPCKYHMSGSHHQFRPNNLSEFRNMLVQLAMEQVQAMHQEAQEYGLKFATNKQKCVLKDCFNLNDNTIFHLNQTFHAVRTNSCSLSDAQTWLSTALTNIETCHSSASQLGVEELMAKNKFSHNVRKMISNVLAVNGEILKQANGNKKRKSHGFPSWFSRHHRKLLSLSSSSLKANIVVAQDGTGNFKTVQDAIDVASRRTMKTRFVIHVKKGVYEENILVDKNNQNLTIVGDGMGVTIITGNRSVKDGITPSMSAATVGIDGAQFIARDITIRNIAGPEKGQAVALRSASDLSVFYRCSIEGYQDTLMAHAQRQFYRDCRVFGTVDFIWGNAAVVLQNCTILVRKPLKGQANMITAQGRGDPFQNTGISIINSQIRVAPDLRPVVKLYNTYLGRPWQQYSRVVIMKSYIEGLVNPLGWSPWGKDDFAQDTLYYGEYMNYGNGSSTKDRVKWPGFHVLTSQNDTQQFSVAELISGNTWLPQTGVPFDIVV